MPSNEVSPALTGRTCFRCADNPTTGGEGPNSGLCRYCILAEAALDAFWQVIVQHFPTAKYGDLSVERTLGLHDAAVTAIREWISNNVLALESDREP